MNSKTTILGMGERMKKLIYCFLISILLCGCSVCSKDATENKEGITIYIENKQYEKSLQQLWNQTYAKDKNAIHFVDQIQEDVDIQWIDDTSAIKKQKHLQSYHISHDYNIPKHLIHHELKDKFTPMISKGYVFCYREDQLQQKYHQKAIVTFEQIVEKQIPYYTNYLDYNIYPFFHSVFESKFAKNYKIKRRMKQYKKFIQRLNTKQNTEYNHIFYEIEPYICGLLYTEDGFERSKSYQEGKLHFQSLPTWKHKTLPLPIKTYGFVVYDHCDNNTLAKQFLKLARSKEGIQCLLDLNIKVPIIQSEDIEDFDIYDYGKKELIQTMNQSELFDNGIWLKESEWLQQNVYKCSEFASILQNYICSDQSIDELNKNRQ